MDNNSQLQTNLKNFLEQLKQSGVDYLLIETIFEYSFKNSECNTAIRLIQDQFFSYFKINPLYLFEYMQFQGSLSISDLSLDAATYKKMLGSINLLKVKYGGIVSNYLQTLREPFLISSVETNVARNESMHTLRIVRGDGQKFEGMFKPASLMPIIEALMNSLRMSMERGIYNIDPNIIEMYLKGSAEFNDYLHTLLAEDKNE